MTAANLKQPMKRIFVSVFALIATIGLAMGASDVIYLKNGSVIKGDIVEQVPGKSLKIKTSDGSLFVCSFDEVERITKEEESHPDGKGHRGLDFGIDAGVDVMDGGANFPIELMLSKRFNQHASLGLGTGVNIPTGGGDVSIPIFLDFKGYLPLKSTKLTPFLDIRGGYVVNTAESYTVGSGKYRVTVNPSDFVMASIMPGVRFPISGRTDLDFGLGYMMYAPTSDGGKVTSAFAIRLGMNFHKSTTPNTKTTKRPPVPTRNTGFEFGLDAYAAQDAGLNLIFGYRLSKKLTVGFGVGFSSSMPELIKYSQSYTYYREPDASGEIVNQQSYEYEEPLALFTKFFLRGEYRFTTKRFSPYVALDLGYRKTLEDDQQYVDALGKSFDMYCSGILVRPAVGVSWRCTNNSYLQLHIDYELSNGGIRSYDETQNISGGWGYDRYNSFRYKCSGGKFSPFSVGITWKHTFALFSRD